jgi:penicillin-binding protein 1A
MLAASRRPQLAARGGRAGLITWVLRLARSPAGPGASGGRRVRHPRPAVRAALGLLAAVVLGTAMLLILTPSARSAAARTRDWITAHHAGPPLTALPARVSAAVLAAEDHRFFQHHGLDVQAVGRAAGGLLTGRDAGGSTIEVQLVKLLYTGGRHRFLDQAEQAAVAVKLDRTYTKTQILLMYLNSEYFGHGFYGVTTAAHGYFNTDPQNLTWGQAALLAGLLKAPSYDDPLRHPDRALVRRSQVVERLRAVGALTTAEAVVANRTTLQLTTGLSAFHRWPETAPRPGLSRNSQPWRSTLRSYRFEVYQHGRRSSLSYPASS